MSDLPITYDAIIIGGGHNGLCAAGYLAHAKLKVLVLESHDELGGMCATKELWPGYQVSRVAHVYTGLHPKIVRDLKLHRHGLKLSARRMATVALGDEGEMAVFSPDKKQGRAATLGLSATDAAAYEGFMRMMGVLSTLAETLGAQSPGADADSERALRQALRRMNEDVAADVVRLVFTSPGDLLAELFDAPLIQGALCMDALLGGSGGPFDGAQMAAWAWRLAGEVAGTRMALGHPAGGMGAIATALAGAIREAGGVVQTGAKVTRILIENGVAYGVETEQGLKIAARAIVSAASPHHTLLGLVGEDALEIDAVEDLKRLAPKGHVSRLTLALAGLPEFRGLPDETYLQGRILIAPSLERLGDAWSAAKKGEPAAHPAFEITIPTTHDPDLAPGSNHILCANVLFTPYDVTGGWEERKDAYTSRLVDALTYYAPGLEDLVLHADLLTPKDIETRYGATGGHWHHAPMSYDNLMNLRFGPKAGDWGALPRNLYFAGAGAHPGGGVTGVPGMLCAEAIIDDMSS